MRRRRRDLSDGRDRVGRRVGNAGLVEGVPSLPAFAALAAVPPLLRIHARQRQLEGNAKFDAEADDLALVHAGEWCIHDDVVGESE